MSGSFGSTARRIPARPPPPLPLDANRLVQHVPPNGPFARGRPQLLLRCSCAGARSGVRARMSARARFGLSAGELRARHVPDEPAAVPDRRPRPRGLHVARASAAGGGDGGHRASLCVAAACAEARDDRAPRRQVIPRVARHTASAARACVLRQLRARRRRFASEAHRRAFCAGTPRSRCRTGCVCS